MSRPGIPGSAASALMLIALSSCTGSSVSDVHARLEPIDPGQTASPEIYRIPQPTGPDGGTYAQRWTMLGREDRAAASESGRDEYAPLACEAVPGSPSGQDAVIDAIAARAADHRVVIIGESHILTRHRDTTRRLLAKLRPLGFSVLAAEAFHHGPNGTSPVERPLAPAWAQMSDGSYTREPAFGRLIREARSLGYRLAAYEMILDPSQPQPTGSADVIAQREAAQARHLAAILDRMKPGERLIVHAGYGHGSEVPARIDGREVQLMGMRLKALTGVDPLTIAQTTCRHAEGPAFLAQPPTSARPGNVDLIVSHPVETFADRRPRWRREAGDVLVAVPASLEPVDEPVVIEAYAWNEPFEAVPIDRVFVEPGEDVPLLLPPGRYRVRAVRATTWRPL